MTDYRPTANWQNLRRRAELLRELREFFHRHGFWEVETPLVSADTVVDRHLDPIAVENPVDGAELPNYWLQTSPEFGMKRLLAAGAESIYQVTRAFRRNELGALHNPEFTLVEWYGVGDDMEAGMGRLSDLAATLLARGEAERLSYRAAFEQYVGIDPLRAGEAELAETARARQLAIPAGMLTADRDSWLHLLLGEIVQPHLGHGRPLILHHYPASQAALARICPDDPAVAERFELYCDGIELANGYHELLDPAELAARQQSENRWRLRDGRRSLPENNRLLSAMQAGLPDCCGVALGFDRLVMVALGARSLSEVMPFPFPRA